MANIIKRRPKQLVDPRRPPAKLPVGVTLDHADLSALAAIQTHYGLHSRSAAIRACVHEVYRTLAGG